MTANDARAAAPPFTAGEIAAAEIVLKTSPRVEPFLGEKLRLARAVLRVAKEHEQGAGSTPTGGADVLPIQGDPPSPPPSPPPAEPAPVIAYTEGHSERFGRTVEATIRMRDGWTVELQRHPDAYEPEWYMSDAYIGNEPKPEDTEDERE